MMWQGRRDVTDLALARYFVVVIFIIIIVVILVRLRLVIFVALERAVRDVVDAHHGLKTTSLQCSRSGYRLAGVQVAIMLAFRALQN